MDEEHIEISDIDWAVNVKPISEGRVAGTVQATKAKFLVLIHDLPDKPYVSVSRDRGKTWVPIPNNQAYSVESPYARWRIDAPAEPAPDKGVWLLVEPIRDADPANS